MRLKCEPSLEPLHIRNANLRSKLCAGSQGRAVMRSVEAWGANNLSDLCLSAASVSDASKLVQMLMAKTGADVDVHGVRSKASNRAEKQLTK